MTAFLFLIIGACTRSTIDDSATTSEATGPSHEWCSEEYATSHPGECENIWYPDTTGTTTCTCPCDTTPPVLQTWYHDGDMDGYGDPAASYQSATAPPYYVDNNLDCDDRNAAIHPGASETCDAANADEDCDGLADDADDSATGKTSWYRDYDNDGYSGWYVGEWCDQPWDDASSENTDCDEYDNDIHEDCDG